MSNGTGKKNMSTISQMKNYWPCASARWPVCLQEASTPSAELKFTGSRVTIAQGDSDVTKFFFSSDAGLVNLCKLLCRKNRINLSGGQCGSAGIQTWVRVEIFQCGILSRMSPATWSLFLSRDPQIFPSRRPPSMAWGEDGFLFPTQMLAWSHFGRWIT